MHADMYSEERLRPLRSYRYQGIDKSLITKYILTPYWNRMVCLMPLWIAPNLITLIGLVFMAASLAVALATVPDLVGPGPSWTYYFFAACLWIYSTLDNIDGKQARRTGSSSPLGELFDHGCDALNCTIGGIVQIVAMGTGASGKSLWILVLTCWAFFLPTWEEYHTGVLYLGYVNGPTEGILLAISSMLISGVYGPSIWSQKLGHLLPNLFAESPLARLDLAQCFLAATTMAFLLIFLPACLHNVWSSKSRRTSFWLSLCQLSPMCLMSLSATAWFYASNAGLRNPTTFCLFALSLGITFAKLATKVIYAHLTKDCFPASTRLLLFLEVGAVFMAMTPLLDMSKGLVSATEAAYLSLYLLVASLSYANWAYHVVNSICGYLGIECFRIRPATGSLKSPAHLK